MKPQPRNIILKLKGLNEWIALDNNTGYHLTGEKKNAHRFSQRLANNLNTTFQKLYHTGVEQQKINQHE